MRMYLLVHGKTPEYFEHPGRGGRGGARQKEENRSHVKALHRWILFARKYLLVYFFKRKNLECLEVAEHAVSVFHYTPCK